MDAEQSYGLLSGWNPLLPDGGRISLKAELSLLCIIVSVSGGGSIFLKPEAYLTEVIMMAEVLYKWPGSNCGGNFGEWKSSLISLMGWKGELHVGTF